MKTGVRNAIFGLKQGQDLENWMALTTKNSQEYPWGQITPFSLIKQ